MLDLEHPVDLADQSVRVIDEVLVQHGELVEQVLELLSRHRLQYILVVTAKKKELPTFTSIVLALAYLV